MKCWSRIDLFLFAVANIHPTSALLAPTCYWDEASAENCLKSSRRELVKSKEFKLTKRSPHFSVAEAEAGRKPKIRVRRPASGTAQMSNHTPWWFYYQYRTGLFVVYDSILKVECFSLFSYLATSSN